LAKKNEREDSFQGLVDRKQKFMVCTLLMGCGIYVEGVQVVLQLRTPQSVLDFVQESRRAG
jgi:superfamily II DNA helicase RecQ